jgi:hypothetical protein
MWLYVSSQSVQSNIQIGQRRDEHVMDELIHTWKQNSLTQPTNVETANSSSSLLPPSTLNSHITLSAPTSAR